MGTHLSPAWSASQSVGAESPMRAEDEINHTNDDSKFELWQNAKEKKNSLLYFASKSPESEIRNRLATVFRAANTIFQIIKSRGGF